MVLRLLSNVRLHLINLREADREHSIAALPAEIPQRFILLLDPERRTALELFDHLGWLTSTCQTGQKVNMVGYPTDNDGLAAQMIKNAAKIAVHLFAKLLVAQEWPSLLCREDRVNEDFGQRLCHGGRMRWFNVLMQPISGLMFANDVLPRVARHAQPWAECCDPVGI